MYLSDCVEQHDGEESLGHDEPEQCREDHHTHVRSVVRQQHHGVAHPLLPCPGEVTSAISDNKMVEQKASIEGFHFH